MSKEYEIEIEGAENDPMNVCLQNVAYNANELREKVMTEYQSMKVRKTS
jgi:hypothetical protein